MRWWQAPRWAWAWAVCVLLMAGGLLSAQWRGALKVNTDVLAMLPQDQRAPEVERAMRQLAQSGEGRVIVLLSAPTHAEAAMDLFIATLVGDMQGKLQVRHRVPETQQADWLGFFAPHRGALLTPAQRQQLHSAPAQALAEQTLQQLMQPMGLPRVGRWSDDPLNTLAPWLAERAQGSPVRALNGRLRVGDALLLMVDSGGSAFAVRDNARLAAALAHARATVPEAKVLMAGVPLHAAAAAAQAQAEMHVIGVGSLFGVFLLSWLAFGRIRPRLLVLMSVGTGLMAAVAVTVLVFGELHLITLVFGASLVGVAENYASSYYSARIDRDGADRFAVMVEQLPAMGLALTTTLAGYALLAVTPFPGLQQVALFSMAGLAAAFLSTLLWFPRLDAGAVPAQPLARQLGRLWQRWPQPGLRVRAVGLLLLVALAAGGLLRLQANDDIRLLQNTPPALMADQIELARAMDLPSPAQFFLVEADSEAALLAREEALKARLLPLQAAGRITGWQAVSDWVPSPARQQDDAALVQSRWAQVAPLLAPALGQPLPTQLPSPHPLSLQAWLAAPVSEAARHQWFGPGVDGRWRSAVLLRGVQGREALAALAPAAQGLEGVRWVDKVADISALLAEYRQRMAGLLLVAVLAVLALLQWHFGRPAWRALAPTLLAGALSMALLGWTGQSLQLFHVLALLLLLGAGVDYGIFLLTQPARQALAPFLSVTLAAISTWLAFGLLALSGTPALRAFGLVLGLGLVLAWLLTPFFMPSSGTVHHANRNR